MTFEIVLATGARKTLDRLPKSERKRLADAILRLKDDPRPPGKKVKRLKAVDGELLRLRVGDKRVIYEVRESKVLILQIVERRDLERWLRKR